LSQTPECRNYTWSTLQIDSQLQNAGLRGLRASGRGERTFLGSLDIEFGRKQTHNQTFPVSVDFFRYDKARLTLTLRPVLLSYSSPDVTLAQSAVKSLLLFGCEWVGLVLGCCLALISVVGCSLGP
jgi:hypothetical protein